MPGPSFLHIAQGDTSCGMLGIITRAFGVPGEVHRIREDLSHGPLTDGRSRMAYMKACCRAADCDYDPDPEADDTDLQWRALVGRVERIRPASVVVWHAENVSDYVFLRMAAHWLESCDVELDVVEVPPRGDDYSVAIYSPEQLAHFWSRLRALDPQERDSLAAEFRAIRSRPEPLRRYDGHALTYLPIETYDGQIVGVVGEEWRPAARTISDLGAGWRDGRNWLSDIFIAARLSALIEAGVVEAEGDRSRIQTYRVRRSPDAV
jgi:hypothetical protein